MWPVFLYENYLSDDRNVITGQRVNSVSRSVAASSNSCAKMEAVRKRYEKKEETGRTPI